MVFESITEISMVFVYITKISMVLKSITDISMVFISITEISMVLTVSYPILLHTKIFLCNRTRYLTKGQWQLLWNEYSSVSSTFFSFYGTEVENILKTLNLVDSSFEIETILKSSNSRCDFGTQIENVLK